MSTIDEIIAESNEELTGGWSLTSFERRDQFLKKILAERLKKACFWLRTHQEGRALQLAQELEQEIKKGS